MNKAALAGFFLLLCVLGAVFWLDPRTPHYRSAYDPQARDTSRWYRDINDWPRLPRYDFFGFDAGIGRTKPLGKPDFAQHYVFGKFRYGLDVQIRGERIYYVSWGVDEQERGGAWMALGEGTKQPDGRWFTIWSCLDLSELGSNGGGAWLEFSPDMHHIFVRYYHDTLPFGESAIEEGEAEALPTSPDRRLEGRVFTFDRTQDKIGDRPFVVLGRVVDQDGQGIPGAAVKRRAAGRIETLSDARGFFRLELDKIEQLTLICAGKLGFTNGAITLDQKTAFGAVGPGAADAKAALATITLHKNNEKDFRNYEYVSPERLERGVSGNRYSPDKHLQCGNCHRNTLDEWRRSRHATMAANPLMNAAFARDAMPVALVRGDKTDRCTPCHSPSLASTLGTFDLNGTTLLNATGVDTEGNHCDFCHKIEAVTDPFKPGLAGSIRMLRPNPADERVPGNIKRVFGALPDVTYLYMGASYNPLFETGALCSGCHEHKLDSGLAGQSTYSEWKQTKFAQPGPAYQECQGCHMPAYRAELREPLKAPGGSNILLPSDVTEDERKHGGKEIATSGTRYRPFSEAHHHDFPGSEVNSLLKGAIAMRVESRRDGGNLSLTVTLENVGAGHAVPTGHGLKRLVLLVSGKAKSGDAFDGANLLPAEERMGALLQSGTVIGRRFFGVSSSAAIQGARNGDSNWSIPYWRAEFLDSDNRLWPGKPQKFEFTLTGAESADVRLLYRRVSPAWLQELGLSTQDKKAGNAPLDTLIHEWK